MMIFIVLSLAGSVLLVGVICAFTQIEIEVMEPHEYYNWVRETFVKEYGV